jgi:hypothetical protein
MQEVRAEHFVNIGTAFEVLYVVTTKREGSKPWSEFVVTMPLDTLRELRRALVALDANISLILLDSIMAHVADFSKEVFCANINELSRRVKDEFSTVKLLHVQEPMVRYYQPREPLFGSEFEEKFGSSLFDLDESAKCLALGRPTAAVFHLMRIMEIGVRATARCLQVPDPTKPNERNWGHILAETRKAIEAKWPTGAVRMSGDRALFEDLYASLDAVKNPWRNATMHVERTYTEDQAEHILVAVKGFMMKLASRCDENGEPKA